MFVSQAKNNAKKKEEIAREIIRTSKLLKIPPPGLPDLLNKGWNTFANIVRENCGTEQKSEEAFKFGEDRSTLRKIIVDLGYNIDQISIIDTLFQEMVDLTVWTALDPPAFIEGYRKKFQAMMTIHAKAKIILETVLDDCEQQQDQQPKEGEEENDGGASGSTSV